MRLAAGGALVAVNRSTELKKTLSICHSGKNLHTIQFSDISPLKMTDVNNNY
jgi:hypothetical protein